MNDELIRALPPILRDLYTKLHTKYLWIMRRPVWLMVSGACLSALAIGVLLLLEPTWVLEMRRSDRNFKIVPWLRRLRPVMDIADSLQSLLERDLFRCCVRWGCLLLAPFTMPLLAVVALCNPAVLRSIVLLTCIPFTALTAFTALLASLGIRPSTAVRSTVWADIKTVAVLLGGPAVSWVATAVTLLLVHIIDLRTASASGSSQTWLRWAVGDAPLGIYLVLLALSLALAAAITTMHHDTQLRARTPTTPAATLQYQRNVAAVTLLAAVVAMWLTSASNPRLRALRSLGV